MIEKTKAIEIEDSFGEFEKFKQKFALDKIDYANLVFLYKVLIVERYSSKKFYVLNYNPLINVNKLHTKLHNVLSESYIESYKSRNKNKKDNEYVREDIKDELRRFAYLPYHNVFVCFTKYVIDRLTQRCDEIKNIKDEVVKKKAIKKLDNTLFHFSNVEEGMKQVIKEGERINYEAQKAYDKNKGKQIEFLYKQSLLECVERSQYCDSLVKLVSDIKKDLHGENKGNNINILSKCIKQQALKIIKEIYHIEDKEAKKRYHDGLVNVWDGKFYKGMANLLQKQIQTTLKKEKPEDKTEPQVNKEEEKSENKEEPQVNNNKNDIDKPIANMTQYNSKPNKGNIWSRIGRKWNKNNSYGTKLLTREEANEMIQKETDCKDFDLNKIYDDNSLNKSKKLSNNNIDSELSQILSQIFSQMRLYYKWDTNQHRQERLKEIEERKKDSFNIDQNGKIIIETKKISKKQEEEMIKRLSKPKEKHIQANTKNSGRKLKPDERHKLIEELIKRLYDAPMGKGDKSGKSKLEKTLTNLNNNKTFITELK